MVRAMVETGITPDFITVDGGEGGTVSHFCACIGSPCLRQCVHGAPIGGGSGPADATDEGNAPQATGKLAASASVGVQTAPAELSSEAPRIRTEEGGDQADVLREKLRHAQAALNDSLAGQERLAAVEEWLVRRRPLRACWRPFGLRFTYMASVLVKNY